jgi:hypothetical protein
MGALINFWVREDTGESAAIEIAGPRGDVIRELGAPARRGLNRVVWDLQADPKHLVATIEAQYFGQPEFVPAGEYTVTVRVGKEKSVARVQVLAAPNAE